jgi:hypothetical protein
LESECKNYGSKIALRTIAVTEETPFRWGNLVAIVAITRPIFDLQAIINYLAEQRIDLQEMIALLESRIGILTSLGRGHNIGHLERGLWFGEILRLAAKFRVKAQHSIIWKKS